MLCGEFELTGRRLVLGGGGAHERDSFELCLGHGGLRVAGHIYGAGYRAPPKPRLSLIQVLADPHDLTGESTDILDVLDRNDLVRYFVDQIMANSQIEKLFHNASYDRFWIKIRPRMLPVP